MRHPEHALLLGKLVFLMGPIDNDEGSCLDVPHPKKNPHVLIGGDWGRQLDHKSTILIVHWEFIAGCDVGR